jgi:hypothetical protein
MTKLISRRHFAQGLAVAGIFGVSQKILVAKKAPNSVVNGVQIGVQSYSFRDRSFEEAIQAIVDVGINSCELWQGHLEPKGLGGEALRKWRLETPLSFFEGAGQKLAKAGIQLSAYNYSFRKDMTDAEIERGFLMARSLGATAITASSNPSVSKRIDGFAKTFEIRVGMHNHAQGGKPDEFDGPKEFAQAMQGTSRFICINLGPLCCRRVRPSGLYPKESFANRHIARQRSQEGARTSIPYGQVRNRRYPHQRGVTAAQDEEL